MLRITISILWLWTQAEALSSPLLMPPFFQFVSFVLIFLFSGVFFSQLCQLSRKYIWRQACSWAQWIVSLREIPKTKGDVLKNFCLILFLSIDYSMDFWSPCWSVIRKIIINKQIFFQSWNHTIYEFLDENIYLQVSRSKLTRALRFSKLCTNGSIATIEPKIVSGYFCRDVSWLSIAENFRQNPATGQHLLICFYNSHVKMDRLTFLWVPRLERHR